MSQDQSVKQQAPDIRWKQRFQNFRRAFELLREALESKNLDEYSDLEQEGIVQRFEYTFELGWKIFKDYLEFNDIPLTVATPRHVIKECAATNIFGEAGIVPEIFLDMMLARNILSHTYDFEYFRQSVAKIKEQYLPELEKAYHYFLEKEATDDA
ncbi:MAG: nucleotidyltransferase substrate binding protein [Planctomycetaceae bacterium]|nr:nucleotidyltransferase substrate binding protein [Planctomycetaceae bacterium]